MEVPRAPCETRCYFCDSVASNQGGDNVSLFKCSPDEKCQAAWAKFCSLKSCNLDPRLRLCNKHFEKTSLRKVATGGYRLEKGSIPTIKPPCDLTFRKTGNVIFCNKSSIKECILCGSSNEEHVFYFQFPEDFSTRQLWAALCGVGVEEIHPSYRICHRHFNKEDITLKSNAIPRVTSIKSNVIINRASTTEHSSRPDECDTSRSTPQPSSALTSYFAEFEPFSFDHLLNSFTERDSEPERDAIIESTAPPSLSVLQVPDRESDSGRRKKALLVPYRESDAGRYRKGNMKSRKLHLSAHRRKRGRKKIKKVLVSAQTSESRESPQVSEALTNANTANESVVIIEVTPSMFEHSYVMRS